MESRFLQAATPSQALYLLPSLGAGLQFSVVRVELQTGDGDQYENHDGDR